MKYTIYESKVYNDSHSEFIFHDISMYGNNAPRVNLVLGTVDPKYISYYIREVEKVLRGEIDQTIISGSEELEDAEDMIVTKEWSKAGRPEEKLETSEVLEFLKIMKREYGVGDEIIEDPRKNFFNIRNSDGTGLHSYTEAIKAYGEGRVIKVYEGAKNSWGAYKARLQVMRNGNFEMVTGTIDKILNMTDIKSMWPDGWSAAQIKSVADEAWKNAKYFEGRNTWKGVTADGKEVLFFNFVDGTANDKINKGIFTNSFPKL